MDPRSTKKGLRKSIRRLRGAASVRITSSFSGAIERSFSDRISNHWQVLGGHFCRPVRLEFRKRVNPFGLLRWPSRRDAKVLRYTFSPKIQLIVSINPGNKVFFETNTNSIQQSWPLEMSFSSKADGKLLPTSSRHEKLFITSSTDAGEKLLTSSLAREFWTSLREVRDQQSAISQQMELERVLLLPSKQSPNQESYGSRLMEWKRAFLLLSKGNLTEKLTGAVHKASGGVKPLAMPVPLYLSIPLVLQNLKSFINQSSSRSVIWRHQTPGLQGAGHFNPPGLQSATTLNLLRTVFNRGLTWSRLSIQNFLQRLGSVNIFTLVNHLRAGDAAAMSQSFLRHLTISDVRHGPSRGASFTSVALTLAPKLAGIDSSNTGAQRLNLSLNLSYVRQEVGQLQAIVSALRELRTSQSESRTLPVPQLPSIEQITREVRQQLERDIRSEKERRGL